MSFLQSSAANGEPWATNSNCVFKLAIGQKYNQYVYFHDTSRLTSVEFSVILKTDSTALYIL